MLNESSRDELRELLTWAMAGFPDLVREVFLDPAPEEDEVGKGEVEIIFGGQFIRNPSRDTGGT